MKTIALILIFSGILLPASAQAKSPVSLIIYLDLSSSMARHRKAVANFADYMTTQLEAKCGEYQVAVSNIRYADVKHDDQELIAAPGEPLFITEKTPDGKSLLHERISIDNEILSYMGIQPYVSGTYEKTYSSVVHTLQSHLQKSPHGLKDARAVGVIILSDAFPMFEDFDPKAAGEKVRAQLGGVPFLAGAIGTMNSQCVDSPFKPGSQNYLKNFYRVDWLKQFAEQNYGYHWDMCGNLSVEDSIKDFILMLMDLGQCQLLV